jgi:hypothetical protein
MAPHKIMLTTVFAGQNAGVKQAWITRRTLSV